MSIGRNIRILREANGLTQRQFAKMIGKTNAAVSQWETECNDPSTGTIRDIARVFGVPTSELTDGDIESATVRTVDPRELEMERIFRELDNGSKDVVLTVARALVRPDDGGDER